MRALVLSLLAILLLPVAARAASAPWLRVADLSQPGPTPAVPSEEETRAWIDRGENFVELLWRSEIHVSSSDEVESKTTLVRHLLTDAGVTDGGNVEIWIDASREQLEIEEAYAVAPDGTVTPVDPRTLEIVENVLPDVFSDWQKVVVPFSGLRPGTAIVLRVTRHLAMREWPLPWAQQIYIGQSVPVVRQEISVLREENSGPLTWSTNDEALECESDDRSISCSRSDVPGVRLDADTPHSEVMDHFLVASELGWAELSLKVLEIVEPSTAATPELRDAVRELIDPEDAPSERLEKLHRFVADEIRYVAFGHAEGAVVPRPASLTLERRFGDCKDKVALLLALARIAGLEVTPLLSGTQTRSLDRMLRPTTDYFDHMIACASYGERDERCMDLTVPYDDAGLPGALDGTVVLPLSRDEGIRPRKLPTRPFQWRLRARRDVSLECDGTVEQALLREFRGPMVGTMRTWLRSSRPDERELWAASQYREAVGFDSVPRFSISGLRSGGEDVLSIRYQSRTPNGYDPGAREYFIYEPWLIYYGRSLIGTNRYGAYRLAGLRYEVEQVISACERRIAFYGPLLSFESRFGKLTQTFRARGSDLMVTTVLEVPSARIEVEELDALQRFLSQALGNSTVWLAQEPAASAR